MDTTRRIQSLRAEGLRRLNRGEFERAEKVFKKLVRIDSSPISRNNLAMSRFQQGDPAGALRILKSNLEAGAPNPFAHALAAQALAVLGQGKDAEEHLNRAVSDFEIGVRIMMSEGLPIAEPWCEYTVLIERAAGDLGHHHLVLDLYHKWKEYHVNPENQFLAGVASFNLGQFSKAVFFWKGSVQPGWEFVSLYAIVAEAAELGIVKRFPVEYRVPDMRAIRGYEINDLGELAQKGWFRMLALGIVFGDVDAGEERPFADKIKSVIRYGGDWGQDLARGILLADGVGKELKMAVAEVLINLGIYEEGEPIKAILNGKKVRLVIQTPRIIEGRDEALEELVGKARSLRDAGKIDEAIEELQPLIAEAICYPPAMLTLANLLRMKDRLDEAEDLLTMLVDITPDQPVVLLNLAGLYLQRGDIDRVKQCVEQLECYELTDEINDMSRLIKKQID